MAGRMEPITWPIAPSPRPLFLSPVEPDPNRLQSACAYSSIWSSSGSP